MNKDFFGKLIVLPLVTGLVLTVLFTAIVGSRIDSILPFNKGAAIAVHDNLTDNTNVDSESGAWRLSDLENNTIIGTAGDFTLRYNADYSLMEETASVMPDSAEFDSAGCIYLKVLTDNSIRIGDTLVLNVPYYGEKQYRFVEEYTVSSERAALSYAPASDGSVIVYYRTSSGIGLSSDYGVMVFEEVA